MFYIIVIIKLLFVSLRPVSCYLPDGVLRVLFLFSLLLEDPE